MNEVGGGGKGWQRQTEVVVFVSWANGGSGSGYLALVPKAAGAQALGSRRLKRFLALPIRWVLPKSTSLHRLKRSLVLSAPASPLPSNAALS